jgi:cytidylate kinase
MTRRVICVSRVLGAGGEDAGRQVAAALGYRYVDEEIVQIAAEHEGVSVDDLVDVERRTKLLDRLLSGLARAGAADVSTMGAGLVPSLAPVVVPDPRSLRELIQKAIHETAERGDVVIVSHAASYALAGRDDVLRVLITASPEVRARRAGELGTADPKKAAKLVADDDAGRAQYLKRFYGVDAELPTHYDLVCNSDRLPLATIVDLVVALAER